MSHFDAPERLPDWQLLAHSDMPAPGTASQSMACKHPLAWFCAQTQGQFIIGTSFVRTSWPHRLLAWVAASHLGACSFTLNCLHSQLPAASLSTACSFTLNFSKGASTIIAQVRQAITLAPKPTCMSV